MAFKFDLNLIKLKLLIVSLMVIWYLQPSYGIPISTTVPGYTCDDNEVAIKNEQGKIKCRELIKKCPHGYGLSFKHIPGKIHPYGTRIACPSCKPGLTYSDTDDFSQCQNCTQCKEHELSTGKCNIDKDSVICLGKCKKGFYWKNSTCLPCSRCCGDVNDEKPFDCSVALVPASKSCSVESSMNCISASNDTSATNGTTENTGIDNGESTFPPVEDKTNPITPDTKPKKSKETGKFVIVGLCSLFVISVPVLGVIVFINRVHVRGVPRAQDLPPVYYDHSTSTSTVYSPSESSLQPTCTDKLLVQPTDMSNNSNVATEIQAVIQGDEIPRNLDTCSWPSDPECTSSLLSDADNTLQLIKDIPIELYQKIVKMLDKKDDFYQDYRFLGEALGMDKTDVDELSNHNSPTSFILQMHSNTEIKRLVDGLTAIGRKDVDNIVELLLHEGA